jgi:hypothetical protein
VNYLIGGIEESLKDIFQYLIETAKTNQNGVPITAIDKNLAKKVFENARNKG